MVTCVSLTRAHKSLYLLESLVASGVSITRPYDTLFDVQHSQKPRPLPVLSKIEERADFSIVVPVTPSTNNAGRRCWDNGVFAGLSL